MENKQLHTIKKSTWRGYSLEELQYERVITLARIEIEKSKLADAAESTRSELPIVGSGSSLSTILRSLSRLEYLLIAIKLYRKISPLFKKKK